MDLDFSDLISSVSLTDDQKNSIKETWKSVFELADNDEDYVWEERLNEALARIRSLIDNTNQGAMLFGETAAHVFQKNTAIDAQMTRFRDRFLSINADARQAFNGYLGELGEQGN